MAVEMNGLDDKDEFTPKFRWGTLPNNIHGNHEYRTMFAGSGKTDRRVPELWPHQKLFLARMLGWGLTEEGGATENARKGQPGLRKPPLLTNSPRTTPKTAPDSSDRQHSPHVTLHQEPLNKGDKA